MQNEIAFALLFLYFYHLQCQNNNLSGTLHLIRPYVEVKQRLIDKKVGV